MCETLWLATEDPICAPSDALGGESRQCCEDASCDHASCGKLWLELAEPKNITLDAACGYAARVSCPFLSLANSCYTNSEMPWLAPTTTTAVAFGLLC